ncbi:MAG: hypothetical protein ACXAEU_15555 [Candidatus Hodarchaeales archaeon]
MVYKLRSMKLRSQVIFLLMTVVFSGIIGTIGVSLVVTAFILPQTPYNIQESEHVEDIWQELGDFVDYSYQNKTVTLNTSVGTVTGIQYKESSLPVTLTVTVSIADVIRSLKIIRENGSVYYDNLTNNLVYVAYDLYNNKTTYQVSCEPHSYHLDLVDHKYVILWEPDVEQNIVKRTPDGVNEAVGAYFNVTNRQLLEWFITIIIAMINAFDELATLGGLLFMLVTLGIIAGFITSLFFTGTRLNRALGGKTWTYFILKRLRGKIGRIMDYIPGLFDFSGDWYLEEGFVNSIDLSSVRSAMKELLRERFYDVLFFPTALSATILAAMMAVVPSDYKLQVLFMLPLFAPVSLLLLILYYSVVWGTDEGGLRTFKISPQGDVSSVKSLGGIIRDGLGIIVGFSGILSLGTVAVDLTTSVAEDSQAVAVGTLQVAGLSFDVFGIILLVLWTVGLFLTLMASITVGTAVLALSYLQNMHLEIIKEIRTKSAEDGVISNFGSMGHQFSPTNKETIISKE